MTTRPTTIPVLVAHRGDAARYPENTLAACEAALKAGACYIEIDIQLTADGIPVLLHDHNLLRTTGHDALITDVSREFLRTLKINDGQQPTAIPTLAAFIELLQQWPQAQAFIEIKEESLAAFGHQRVLEQILDALAPLQSRCIPISYDIEILQQVREQGEWKIGWVARRYDQVHHRQAQALAPDFLICNHAKTGAEPLWPGPWQWLLYEVTEPELALRLCRRGAHMIETMAIGEMLKDKDLSSAACHPLRQS